MTKRRLTAFARGYKRGLHVEVTVQDGMMAGIKIGDNNEDEPYLTDALAIIPEILNPVHRCGRGRQRHQDLRGD